MAKDRIDPKWIMNKVKVNSEIVFYETTDSTNTRLKELARGGSKSGTVVVAEYQTNGRGRLGRSFYSPNESGIYMSLLIRPDEKTDIGMLTAYTSVAVCNALETVSSFYFRDSEKNESEAIFGIKWVNDIIMNGKKVCGILAEAGVEENDMSYIVVGVGINVYSPDNGFPKDLENVAESIFPHKKENIRNRIITEVINNFYSYSTDFVSEYRKRSTVIGKNINVHLGSTVKKAYALDIDEKCNLKVKYENGEIDCLSFGEISVRTV